MDTDMDADADADQGQDQHVDADDVGGVGTPGVFITLIKQEAVRCRCVLNATVEPLFPDLSRFASLLLHHLPLSFAIAVVAYVFGIDQSFLMTI